MTPKRSDLVLTTDIPDCEGDVLIFDGLHVETNRRNSRDDLSQLELVHYRVSDNSHVEQRNRQGCVARITLQMVVLPAASKPTIRIRISRLPKRPWSSFEMERP